MTRTITNLTATRYLILLIGIVFLGISVTTVFAQETQQEPVDENIPVDQMTDLPRAPESKPETKKMMYNPQGARDPFRSLLERPDNEMKPKGLAGLQISELSLQGLQIGLGKLAIVTAPDGTAYGMKVNDETFDGKLVNITNNKVVFEKIIYDPFGRVKETKQIEIYLHRK